VHKGGIGSHTKPNQGDTNTWLTPEAIIKALGPFDLDPCAAPSPRPWPTAKSHMESPENRLADSWRGQHCAKCGWVDQVMPEVQPARSILEVPSVCGRAGTAMHEMPGRTESSVPPKAELPSAEAKLSPQEVRSLPPGQDSKSTGLYPEETGKGRSVHILPRLRAGDCSNPSGPATGVSHREDEAIGREATVSTVGEGARSKTYPERHGQPRSQTAQSGGPLPLGPYALGRVSETLEPCLRLLRSSGSEDDAGSLHSAERPSLSRHSSLEYGSGLPELQLQQTEAFPLRLDEGSRACCPYCGGITEAAPYRTYLNPPYYRHEASERSSYTTVAPSLRRGLH
jgi:hypothetical protein